MIVKSCSFSSDKKLARCEQQFDYRYGQQLKPKIKKLGLYKGDWIHQLLQAHYTHGIPTRRIKTRHEMTRGGWKQKFDELKKKLWDPLFDEEKEGYGLDFLDTVRDLLEHYVDHWSEWDKDWELLHIEQRYEMITKLGFPVRWQADLIVRDKRENSNILVETKAKKAIPDSSERVLQPQVHAYAFLLGKKGIKIDSILWNYIRTTPIPRPQIKKDGNLSERKINTDRRSYSKSLQEAGITADTSSEWLAIQTKLESLPETLSLERIKNTPNLKLGERFVRDWVERHRRALAIKRPLLSYNRNCAFDCDYYELCLADMTGKVDRNLIIKKNFVSNIGSAEEELK